MVIEDFFTLSEMKDGLSNVARVQELISVMESQDESVRGIGGDAVRQWTTVSRIIAVTEREDCLKLFLRLNGLSFLNHWLEEVQNYKKDAVDSSSTDELINAMLLALDRLPADQEASSTSRIGSTIRKLHGEDQNNSEKIKLLIAKWSYSEDGEDELCRSGDGDESKSSSSSRNIDAEEDCLDSSAKEEVNAVDDDVAAQEDGDSGEAIEVAQNAVELSTPNEVLSVSQCPSPETQERRDDADERSSCLHNKYEAVGRAERVDIEAAGPRKISFVSSEMLSSSRRMGDPQLVSELEKESEIKLEYGEIDALEVARQVAIEVEREVVDYREPFCSSSPDVAMSDGEMVDPAAEPGVKKVDIEDHAYSAKEDGNDDDKDGDDDNDDDDDEDDDEVDKEGSSSEINIRNLDPMKSPSSANGSSVDAEKKLCRFDLNEDVSSAEEDDNHGTEDMTTASLSTPVAVAASKGAPAMPVAPLHFEGELGWRGSAATSAFRPAYLPGLKSKGAVISIDLNVAEDEDEGAVSVYDPETSSRSDRLKLDLNRSESDEPPQSHASFWRQNGVSRCGSPASSSSGRQPLRDFDLNDDPSAMDLCGSSGSIFFSPAPKEAVSSSSFRSFRLEDSAVMIMGSRLGADQRDVHLQPLGHRSAPFPAPMAPPLPRHGFGFGTPMSVLPPPYYAGSSVPYMVDTSGAAVVPQILSSAGVSQVGARPPFLMGVVGPPAAGISIGGSGGSRPGLDLNSGGPSGHGEDRVLKRKEPDCGWDPAFAFGCKQATSWQ